MEDHTVLREAANEVEWQKSSKSANGRSTSPPLLIKIWLCLSWQALEHVFPSRYQGHRCHLWERPKREAIKSRDSLVLELGKSLKVDSMKRS